MNTTFLIAVFLITACSVSLAGLVIHLFAESKWRHHPLAQCSYQRVTSFNTAY